VAKKIKSFTVDEDTYNALVLLFKDNKVKSSLSLFVNNSLKQLLDDIHLFIEASNRFEDFDIPLPFVIGEMVNEAYKAEPSYELMGEDDKAQALIAYGDHFRWKYEAFKMQVPVAFCRFISSGLYVLSADRQYLIHKESGKKYLPTSETSIREIGEEKS